MCPASVAGFVTPWIVRSPLAAKEAVWVVPGVGVDGLGGPRLEGRVVLYDRFIWSTYIKYYALRYPVRPLSALYLLPRPLVAIVLDIPVDKSLGVIQSRESHIRYPRAVLETERRLYLKIAKERGYPVIDSTRDAPAVQEEIERHLSRYFPVVTGGGTAR